MKKLSILIPVGFVLCAISVSCATWTITPASIAATLCPSVQSAVTTIKMTTALGAPTPVSASASAALTKIEPTITAACSGAALVTSDSVQSLITKGLPALGIILGTLPLPAATLAALEKDFTIAEQAIDLADVVVQNIEASKKVAAVMVPVKK